jgi:hypothetical protein
MSGRSRSRDRSRGHGHGDAAAPGPVLWSASFASLDLGAAAVLPGGLALTRAAVASVQTGASTLVTGIATDTARVGQRTSDAATRGLVLEGARTNLLSAPRDPNGAGWAAALLGTTTTGQTSPDGTTNAWRNEVQSGGHGRYTNGGTLSTTAQFSVWVRVRTANQPYQVNTATGTQQAVSAVVAHTTWFRAVLSVPASGAASLLIPADGRENGAFGGAGPFALDTDADLLQIEYGAYPTEWTAGARPGERLYLASPAALVSEGTLGLYARLQPKGASAQYAAAPRLWTDAGDATTYVEIDPVTGAVTVSVAGDAYTAPVALVWTAHDDLELFVRAGGVPAVHYRVGGAGAWTELSTDAPADQGPLALTGALDLLCAGTTKQFTARVQSLVAYRAGTSPVT